MKALLYTRVSHEEQVKYGSSLDSQLDALKQYCADNGYTVKGIYTDEGISGASIKKREALTRMLNEANAGDVILFTKLDRFSRNLLDANLIVQELDKKHVSIKAIHEDDIDTTSADGKFIFNLKLSLAQREREKTSERIRDVFAFKKANCEVTSGSVPIGYKIVNKRMVIDPDAKDMALFIFNAYDRLGNVQSTHKAFVERYGNIKGINAIRNTLRNEKYIGINGENTAFCEPLIDAGLFHRVQKRLAQNVKKAPSKEVYLFSRLLVCPKCGASLYSYRTQTTRTVYHYYRCTNNQYAKGYACDFTTVREDRIEMELLEKVGILANETKYRFKRASADDSGKKIETIRKKLDRLKELYIDGDIDKATYLRRKSAFESELREHEELHQPTIKASVDEILTLNVREIYEALTAENKRAFWHHFIERIHVDEAGHVVHIDFL